MTPTATRIVNEVSRVPAGVADGMTANVASLVGTVSQRVAAVPELVGAVSGRVGSVPDLVEAVSGRMASVPDRLSERVGPVAELVAPVAGLVAPVSGLVGSVSERLPDRDQLATLEAAGRDRLRQLAESGIVASGVQAGMDPRRRRQVLVPLAVVGVAVGVVLVVGARRRRAQRARTGEPTLISV